jgi:hypothetical protein
MKKNPLTIDKDQSRMAGLIANIRYEEPPEFLTENVMARIRPKKLTFMQRLARRLRTPVAVTPLKLLPAGISGFAVLVLAIILLRPVPNDRITPQEGTGLPSQSLHSVVLFLDRPDARDVEVLGSFNNWSKEGIRMTWDNDRSLWMAVLHLKRGSYEYAFRVNQEEIVADPKAVLKRDDGFGHQNSILIIGNGNGNETRI